MNWLSWIGGTSPTPLPYPLDDWPHSCSASGAECWAQPKTRNSISTAGWSDRYGFSWQPAAKINGHKQNADATEEQEQSQSRNRGALHISEPHVDNKYKIKCSRANPCERCTHVCGCVLAFGNLNCKTCLLHFNPNSCHQVFRNAFKPTDISTTIQRNNSDN